MSFFGWVGEQDGGTEKGSLPTHVPEHVQSHTQVNTKTPQTRTENLNEKIWPNAVGGGGVRKTEL